MEHIGESVIAMMQVADDDDKALCEIAEMRSEYGRTVMRILLEGRRRCRGVVDTVTRDALGRLAAEACVRRKPGWYGCEAQPSFFDLEMADVPRRASMPLFRTQLTAIIGQYGTKPKLIDGERVFIEWFFGRIGRPVDAAATCKVGGCGEWIEIGGTTRVRVVQRAWMRYVTIAMIRYFDAGDVDHEMIDLLTPFLMWEYEIYSDD